MANVCKSCGGDGEQVVFNYCRGCVDAHTRGEKPLGGCQRCDILGDQQRDQEEMDAASTPGA